MKKLLTVLFALGTFALFSCEDNSEDVFKSIELSGVNDDFDAVGEGVNDDFDAIGDGINDDFDAVGDGVNDDFDAIGG